MRRLWRISVLAKRDDCCKADSRIQRSVSEPLILDCASVIIAKRDTFRAVPMVGDLVNPVAQYHLMNLKTSRSKFVDACITATSVRQFVIHPSYFESLYICSKDDHVDRLKSLKTRSNAATDRALAA